MTTFDPLFVPEELRDAVSGRAWLAAMLDVERALANAGSLAGVVPASAAAAIAEACASAAFEWEELLTEARAVGNPAEPLARALAASVADDVSRFVHLGATSQDVMDTAAMIVARRALELVLEEARRVARACAALARTYRDTPMAGRTLLQQAVPTTFGAKAAGWLVAVVDARRRLVELREHGLAAQLGGAAGTLATLGDRGVDVLRLFAAEVDLVEPAVPWHTNRVRIAELGAALGIFAGVIAKIGLDLALLAQTEIGEVREHGGGSSTMPQKRNPLGSVLARACARTARGHASVLEATLVQEHERAAGAWHAEWGALSGSLAYAGGAAAALAGALESLEVDTARMRANLDLTEGLVMAERLSLLAMETMGRAGAQELLARASREAASAAGTLRDALLADPESPFSAVDLDTALEPTAYLGSAGAFVDRALALDVSEEEE